MLITAGLPNIALVVTMSVLQNMSDDIDLAA